MKEKESKLYFIRGIAKLWPYLVIFIFVLAYYYFFTEKLPWFWYDDINALEYAENNPPLVLLGKIFDFMIENFAYDPPTARMFTQFCNFMFGENPHYFRLVKIIFFSVTLCLTFYLTFKNGGDKLVTLLGILVFATFPAVMIANTFICDSGTLELLFKISSFIVFFALISESGEKISLRFIVLNIVLILLLIFADKSRATAKIIPLIFLTYLFLTRHKKRLLYAVVLISGIVLFPWAVLHNGSSVSAFVKHFYPNLVKTFLNQTWLLFTFALGGVILIRNIDFLKNKYVLFAFLWLIYEIIFYVFYPSGEIRYLFASLAASVMFLSVLISRIFMKITRDNLKKIAILGFILIILSLLVQNTYWNYNFRGSICGYLIVVDKKIKFINQNYKNSLCLYSRQTLPYYSRNTTNQYVNLNPDNAWNKQYYDIASMDTQGLIKILNPERYENIIFLEENILYSNAYPTMVFDMIIENSLYDLFQRTMGFKIRSANLHNTSLHGVVIYPQYSAIYVKQKK